MEAVPQKELRNNIGQVLKRAEEGEELTITVAGRPVAQLGPIGRSHWVPSSRLAGLWSLPPDPTLEKDLEFMGGEMVDPWTKDLSR
jgi:prevent-host-death family protein